MKVMEKVPYVKGLDRWLGTEINEDAIAYLKDFGAATASNGAVGLYHIEHLTPEAVQQGEALIREGAPVYVIDDAELRRVRESYPCVWKNRNAKPKLCFMGCPAHDAAPAHRHDRARRGGAAGTRTEKGQHPDGVHRRARRHRGV